MPAVDRAELARKQRERKQKILLIFMLLVLVVMVIWQGPKTLKRLKGESSAAPAAQTATTATAPTTTTSAGGSTSTTADPQAALAAEKNLGDTDVPPTAGESQLISFSRFDARDPFVQLVDADSSSPTTPEDGAPSTSTTSGGTTPPPSSSGGAFYPPPSASGGGTTTTGQVTVSINGKSEKHGVGEAFPTSDPAFQIASVNGDSVEIGLASGQFSGGQQTITVKVGDEVTLVSQPDGARYTIKVISIS
jgi:hypothetical protein